MLLGIFFLCAGKFLSSPASAPQKSDLVVVLGGDSGFRVPKAFEIYEKGYAPNVALIGYSNLPGVFKPGVIPRENIFFDTKSNNSWDEAVNTFVLMKKKGWKSVIVISDPPHLLRVRYAWNKVLGNSGIRSTLVSGELSNWNAKRWWENDLSRRYVISEYLKLGYFIYEYHMGSRFSVHSTFAKASADMGSRLKNTDTDTHTGTDFDEKEHERLRKICPRGVLGDVLYYVISELPGSLLWGLGADL